MAITINSKYYNWSSIEVSVQGDTVQTQLSGLTSFSYKTNVETVNVYGTGKEPLGQSKGQITYDAIPMEFYVQDWYSLAEELTAWGEDQLRFVINYAETSASLIHTLTLEGTFMSSAGQDAQGSADPSKKTMEFMPTKIIEPGAAPRAV